MGMKEVTGLLGGTGKEILGLMQLDQKTRAAQATATELARQFDVGTIQTQQSNVGKMYENRFNENQKLVGSFVTALADNPALYEDDSFRAMMTTAQSNVQSAERDMLQNWGVDISETTQHKLASVINEIFKSEQEKFPDEDLRTHLTWNDNWSKLIKKRMPDVDAELLEMAWKGKLIGLPKSKDGSWVDLVGKGATSILGYPMDFTTGILNVLLPKEGQITEPFLGSESLEKMVGPKGYAGRASEQIIGNLLSPDKWGGLWSLKDIGLGGDEDANLKQMEAEAVNRQRQMEAQVSLASQLDQQSIVDASTGASSPISGFYPGSTEEAGANLRNRFKDIVDAPTPLMGQQGLMNGYFAQTTPQQKQLPDLSREARAFLRKLNEYLLKYGEEEAQLMLSREYRNLKRSDKQKLEEYFTSRNESEALA